MKRVHSRVADWLPLYIVSSLPLDEQRHVERHLADCTECRQAVAEWRTIGRNVQSYSNQYQRHLILPPLTLPPYREDSRLHKAKDRSEKEITMPKGYAPINELPSRSRLGRRLVGGGLLVTSVLAVLLVVVTVVNTYTPPLNPVVAHNTGALGQPLAVPTALPTTAPAPSPTALPTTSSALAPTGTGLSHPFAASQPKTLTSVKPGSGDFVSWTNDLKSFATIEKEVVQIWRADGSLVTKVAAPTRPTGEARGVRLNWSPDGQTLTVAYEFDSGSGANSQHSSEVQLWTATGENRLTLPDMSDQVVNWVWSPDSTMLTISSSQWDGHKTSYKLQSWTKGGQEIKTVDSRLDRVASRLIWSPDGKLLAVGLETGESKDIGELQVRQPDGTILTDYKDTLLGAFNHLIWSPDGQWLAAGRASKTDNLRLYSRLALTKTQAQPFVSLNGHTDFVLGLAWSPDSLSLASSAVDQTVRVWDVPSGQNRLTLPTDQVSLNLAWSPDGRWLVAPVHQNGLQVWDKTGQPLAKLATGSNTIDLGWAADSGTLVSVLEGGTIQLWQP